MTHAEAQKRLSANEYLTGEDKRQILQWLDGREIPEEEWRDIPGLSGSYKISNMGRVMSVGRVIQRNDKARSTQSIRERILKQSIRPDGYLGVYPTVNCKKFSFQVHRLVAVSFIPNPDDKPEVNHRLGIKAFNWAIGIEWATRKENIQHAVDNGLITPPNLSGEDHPNSKLTDQQVADIRAKYSSGDFYQRELAEKYSVTQTQISDIVNNRRRIDSGYKVDESEINNSGENNGMSVLSEKQASEIKSLKGKKKQLEIANKYGISQSLVSRIHTGKSWGHL